jgi:hypothetical protein
MNQLTILAYFTGSLKFRAELKDIKIQPDMKIYAETTYCITVEKAREDMYHECAGMWYLEFYVTLVKKDFSGRIQFLPLLGTASRGKIV